MENHIIYDLFLRNNDDDINLTYNQVKFYSMPKSFIEISSDIDGRIYYINLYVDLYNLSIHNNCWFKWS